MEIIIDMPIEKKTTCRICFDDDLKTDQMFYVASCGHRLCVECMKQHVEVGLLQGSVMIRCPYYLCKSKLTLRSCANLLKPKLRAMWERRIEEELIPITGIIYCPNPKCSVLMSKTSLSGVKSCCVKCGQSFCIDCKVPWHSNLSCDDYKRLGLTPYDTLFKGLANRKMWRQCGKCQNMVELSEGCKHITCRCGYSYVELNGKE